MLGIGFFGNTVPCGFILSGHQRINMGGVLFGACGNVNTVEGAMLGRSNGRRWLRIILSLAYLCGANEAVDRQREGAEE
jgi:hypothetical protein